MIWRFSGREVHTVGFFEWDRDRGLQEGLGSESFGDVGSLRGNEAHDGV